MGKRVYEEYSVIAATAGELRTALADVPDDATLEDFEYMETYYIGEQTRFLVNFTREVN